MARPGGSSLNWQGKPGFESARNWLGTTAASTRPQHQPGWTSWGSLPHLILQRQADISAGGGKTKFHDVLKIADFPVLPYVLEVVNTSLLVVDL
ncbi:MAG TPA: hypothetical protein VKY92_09510 [Verrucomicrobiae bacterium]|nr:hypothetical protein [Verrucomicrobiae bacterium]